MRKLEEVSPQVHIHLEQSQATTMSDAKRVRQTERKPNLCATQCPLFCREEWSTMHKTCEHVFPLFGRWPVIRIQNEKASLISLLNAQ